MKMKIARAIRGRYNQYAYTLAEMAVGTALLGIAFVSLYGGMSQGFAITRASRENLRATQIILERMEGIRLYNWNQLVYSNWIPSSFTNYYYPLTSAGQSPGIPYVGTMTIGAADLSPSSTYATNMRSITVTVNWNSSGVDRSRSVVTYVAQNGIQNYVYAGPTTY